MSEKRIESLTRCRVNDALTLAALLDDYLEELAKHREFPVDAMNVASYRYLSLYWSEQDRFPFLIGPEKEPAGFALIRRIRSEDNETMQVAEFYVVPEKRRNGLGSAAVSGLWKRFPGKWELQVHKRNEGATQFWIKCIKKYAAGFYEIEEIDVDDGRRLVFHFST